MPDVEDRWRAALEAAGIGVWDWDLAANRIYYSRIWKAIRGLAEDEPGPAVGDWESWVHPDDLPVVTAGVSAYVQGQSPHYEFEHRIRRKDGSYRWILARGMTAERDADGRPTRIVGTNMDIDAAKRASIHAERHNRLLRAIAECNMAIARRKSVSELSEDICRVLVDRGEMAMAWVGRPTADGSRIEVVASYNKRPDALNLDGIVISTRAEEPSGRGPSGIAFRTGEAVWVENAVTDPRTALWRERASRYNLLGTASIPIHSKAGPIAVLTFYTDEPAFFDETTRALLEDMAVHFGLALDALEAERAAEQYQHSLYRSEQRTRAMFEMAPLGIALKELASGRYIDVNPKFVEIVGHSREALLGMRWQDITHPDDVPEEMQLTDPFLNGEVSSLQVEKRYIRSDGGVVSVNMTLAHFEAASDGSRRYLAMIEDVTDRKELQQQLSQRQRLEALGHLTGGIAHDFNNLLTVIIGNSEALALELGENDLGELANLILTTGERAADLTGRLLTFARKQSLLPRSVKAGELIDGVLPLLKRVIPDGIELRLATPFSNRAVYADPAQLEMALLNLVLNARDALPLGGWIEIASEDLRIASGAAQHGDLQPGRYVVLSLSDNGVGMSETTVERAFDPFFTTKGPGGGSGLGLSMVYGFARQSGGSIELASRLGEGTTVKLYLPAIAHASAESVEAQDTPADRGAGETVLIAEDDPMVRKFVTAQVDSLGYATIAMPDGKSALEVLRSGEPIDLLFTDIAMEGGMDGIELAGWARIVRPGLPVLFTSGHAEQHVERLNEIDALLLKKPYRKRDLADHLRQALLRPPE